MSEREMPKDFNEDEAWFVAEVMNCLRDHPSMLSPEVLIERRKLDAIYDTHGRFSEGAYAAKTQWLMDYMKRHDAAELVKQAEELKAYKDIVGNAFAVILNANDFFAWGCADAVSLDSCMMDKTIELYRKHGPAAVDAVMVWLRKEQPQKPIMDRIEKMHGDAYRAALKDLEGFVPYEGFEYEDFGVDRKSLRELNAAREELKTLRDGIDKLPRTEDYHPIILGQNIYAVVDSLHDGNPEVVECGFLTMTVDGDYEGGTVRSGDGEEYDVLFSDVYHVEENAKAAIAARKALPNAT